MWFLTLLGWRHCPEHSWTCSYSIAMSWRVRLADVQFDTHEYECVVWTFAAWTCNMSKSNVHSTSNCQKNQTSVLFLFIPSWIIYLTTIPYCSPVTLQRPGREHWEMDAKQQLRQVRGWKGDQTGLNTLKKNGSWTAPFCKTSNFDIQHRQLKIIVIMQGPKHCSLP